MKTVIIDNSLSVNTLADNVDTKYIYAYLEALAQAGIKYAEIDFRTAMLMPDLPKGIGYIFRLIDPMFLDMAEAFNYDYLLVTLSNLKNGIKTDVPVMLELPATEKPPRPAVIYASERIDGIIAVVRLVSNFKLMKPEEAASYVNILKNNIPIPIDLCPMNTAKTALDSALKFADARVDSITMTMGLSEKFASIEEFLLTLLSVYHVVPNEFNIPALCKAMIYHRRIFKHSEGDSFSLLMNRLNKDITNLKNADTGERVHIGLAMRETHALRKQFISAFERMAEKEDIPEDIAGELMDAVRHFDMSLYNAALNNKTGKGLLN